MGKTRNLGEETFPESVPKIECVTDSSSVDEGEPYAQKGFPYCCPKTKTCCPKPAGAPQGHKG